MNTVELAPKTRSLAERLSSQSGKTVRKIIHRALALYLGIFRELEVKDLAIPVSRPEKCRANKMAAAAVARGEIAKPPFCQFCGHISRDLDMHHANYRHPLSVVWLCCACHDEADRRRKLKELYRITIAGDRKPDMTLPKGSSTDL